MLASQICRLLFSHYNMMRIQFLRLGLVLTRAVNKVSFTLKCSKHGCCSDEVRPLFYQVPPPNRETDFALANYVCGSNLIFFAELHMLFLAAGCPHGSLTSTTFSKCFPHKRCCCWRALCCSGWWWLQPSVIRVSLPKTVSCRSLKKKEKKSSVYCE